jgi:hypothetical protein
VDHEATPVREDPGKHLVDQKMLESAGREVLVGTTGDRATAGFYHKGREPWKTDAVVLAVPPARKRDGALRVTPVMIPSLAGMSRTGWRKETERAFRRIVRGPWKSREKRWERSVAREHEIPELDVDQGRGF